MQFIKLTENKKINIFLKYKCTDYYKIPSVTTKIIINIHQRK